MRGRASAGTRRSGEEEGKSKGRRPPWKLWSSEPVLLGERDLRREWTLIYSMRYNYGARSNPKGREWQNLYPRREIMVLGMGLKGEGWISKNRSENIKYM